MTAEFLTPLRMEKIGAHRWLLIDELWYQSAILPGIFVVPRGFQTDLASIPRPFWTVFPPVDVYDQVAVLHDAAYGNALLTARDDRIFLIKRWADRLFQEGLEVVGVGNPRRWLMYRLVTRFGDPLGHPLAAHREGDKASS